MNYKNTEKMLKLFKPFMKDPEQKMDVKIRKAGEPMWKKFDEFNKELNAKIEAFKQYTEQFCKDSNVEFESLLTPNYVEKMVNINPYENDEEVAIPPKI